MVKSKCVLFHLAWAERRKYESKKRKKKQISIIVGIIERKNEEAYRKADREKKFEIFAAEKVPAYQYQ